jgi:tripartite ATP-independent transporter DctP family solute receptor
MNAMKRIVLTAVVFTLLGGTSVGAAEKILLKVGHDSPTTHPYQRLWEKFGQVLETEAPGAVQVQIFPDAQLGDEPKMLEALRLGALDAMTIASVNLAPSVPEVDLFSLPFLFRDLPHLYRVVDGPIGQRLATTIEAKSGALVLGWMAGGTRLVWNKKKPIYRPEDLRGVKLRVMGTPIMVDTFSTLGAQATTVAFTELYTALQQGVVDGADNDVVDILSFKFNEVTKYVSETNHVILAVAVIFSKNRYDRLSPEIQRAVVKAGKEATTLGRKTWDGAVESAIAELKQKGLQFNKVDLKPFKEAAQKIYPKYAEKVGGAKLIEEVEKQ